MRGLSPVVASGGHSSSLCAGLSLSQPLLLRSTGSRRAGSVVVAHGPNCSAACGIFPDQGLNPRPLHWQADSQPLRHQGSPKLLTMANRPFVIWPLSSTQTLTSAILLLISSILVSIKVSWYYPPLPLLFGMLISSSGEFIILSKPGSGIIASGKLSLMSPGFLSYIQSLLHHVQISTTFLHCNILSPPIYLPVKTTTLTYSDIIICFTHLIVS